MTKWTLMKDSINNQGLLEYLDLLEEKKGWFGPEGILMWSDSWYNFLRIRESIRND